MAGEITFSPAAEEDLAELLSYYSDVNPQTAQRYFDRVFGELRRLRSYPQSGRIVPEFEQYGELRYRELVVEQFRAIYRIASTGPVVIRIIDGRRLVSREILPEEPD
jgi:plasmid stabilization system protein ParE